MQISSRSSRRRVLPGLAGLLLAAAAGAGQPSTAPSSQPRSGIFFESLNVSLVNLDVYVTDREGHPVPGLAADDFEVLEDGRPVTISHFAAVHRDLASVRQQALAIPRAPEPGDVAADREAAPRRPEDRLYLIVYFDNVFVAPLDRNQVAQAINRFFFQHLLPGDEVMVATYERSLHIRQPFTDKLSLVVRAVDAVEKLSALGAQEATDRQKTIERILAAKSPGEAEPLIQFYAEDRFLDRNRSLDTLHDLVSSMGGLPGRKALLYVSNGLPMTTAEDLYALLDDRFRLRGSHRLQAARYRDDAKLRELVAQANANRVTFYTLEAAGSAAYSSVSAEYSGSTGSVIEADSIYESNKEQTLLDMARDTGGIAAVNTNNFEGALFDRMIGDFEDYYSLAYTSPHSGDGQYHRIEVTVDRPGVHVRSRNGYRDKTLETKMHEGTLAALLYDAQINPLSVEVMLGKAAPKPGDEKSLLVPIEVHIPLAQIVLVPRGGGLNEGRVDVSLAVVDRQGDMSPLQVTQVPITVPDADLETARGKSWVYQAQLLMQRGRQAIAVGVLDELAGQSSFLRRPVTIGE